MSQFASLDPEVGPILFVFYSFWYFRVLPSCFNLYVWLDFLALLPLYCDEYTSFLLLLCPSKHFVNSVFQSKIELILLRYNEKSDMFMLECFAIDWQYNQFFLPIQYPLLATEAWVMLLCICWGTSDHTGRRPCSNRQQKTATTSANQIHAHTHSLWATFNIHTVFFKIYLAIMATKDTIIDSVISLQSCKIRSHGVSNCYAVFWLDKPTYAHYGERLLS